MLKFLIVLLCIFFLIRIIGRMFVAKTFNSFNKRFEEQFQQRQQQQQQQQNQSRPEGRITIDPNTSGNNKGSSNDGEYVDYEEVK